MPLFRHFPECKWGCKMLTSVLCVLFWLLWSVLHPDVERRPASCICAFFWVDSIPEFCFSSCIGDNWRLGKCLASHKKYLEFSPCLPLNRARYKMAYVLCVCYYKDGLCQNLYSLILSKIACYTHIQEFKPNPSELTWISPHNIFY